MNNLGNPELSEPQANLDKRRVPIWLWIMPLVFVLALWVTAQSLTWLLALVMPPMPPVPAGVRLLNHETRASGQDVWRYEGDLCQSMAFYAQQDALCRWYSACPEGGRMMPNTPLGTCQGVQNFAGFGMRWQVQLDSTGAPEQALALVRLSRELSWAGTFPTPDASGIP